MMPSLVTVASVNVPSKMIPPERFATVAPLIAPPVILPLLARYPPSVNVILPEIVPPSLFRVASFVNVILPEMSPPH